MEKFGRLGINYTLLWEKKQTHAHTISLFINHEMEETKLTKYISCFFIMKLHNTF